MKLKEYKHIELTSQYFDKNSIFLDIGAATGEWSKYSLSKFPTKKIILFEPDDKKFHFLQETFSSLENVELINSGVGSKSETKVYYYIPENPELSGFVNRSVYQSYRIEYYDLDIISLDNYFDYNISIDFIKIDVEGFEYEVLLGMDNILKNKSVKFIQIEYGGTYLDNGTSLNEVILYLNRYGYRMYDVVDDKFVELKNFDDNYKYNNYLISYYDI